MTLIKMNKQGEQEKYKEVEKIKTTNFHEIFFFDLFLVYV